MAYSSEAAYAGDLTPSEAWRRLEADPAARLVDVRTDAEWNFVGLPDLRSLEKQAICVSWQVLPAMALNADFAAELEAKGAAKEQTLLLICRSGVRSRHAAIALTQAGYRECYNVSDGFEGNHDPAGHRGTTGGWKAEGLPWVQG